MNIRIARHTRQLQPIIEFYCEMLELEVLGEFNAHQNYDGIFIGLPGKDWHLEFTVSNEAPEHHPDEDDLLVFYVSPEEYNQLHGRFNAKNISPVEPKNPYWKDNGITYIDPDGYRIVISTK